MREVGGIRGEIKQRDMCKGGEENLGESQRRLGEPRLYKTSINEEEREEWR